MSAKTASAAAEGGQGRAAVSTATAIAICVADMVGIGVFTSLGFQVLDITSGFSILLLWLVGGVAALSGALSYAELGAMFPRSGGEYNFLSRSYHPAFGFMAGWLSATVGFAAPVALAAMAFGSYAEGVWAGAPKLLLGVALVWGVTLVHLTGVEHGSRFQNISTALKVALILTFIAAGLTFGEAQPVSFSPADADPAQIFAAPFAIGLVYVMYSYSGWNGATYIIGEMDDPQRTVPRAIVTATLIVIALYVGLNAVFLYTTPISAMAGKIDIALISGTHIFGDAGGRFVAFLICFGLISTVSAMMWIGPRVTQVMGEDAPVFGFLASRSPAGVPARAILLQASVATLLMMTQSFEDVLEFIQFAITLSSFATVLGVMVLRWRKPGLPRPYRTPFYPLPPLVFLGVTAFMMYYLAVERPLHSLAGLALMATGLLVYWLFYRKDRNAPRA